MGLIERTRRALEVAQEDTPRWPGRGLDGLKREREERAWRFLEALTLANTEAMPRYVSRFFVAQLFSVSPQAAAVLLRCAAGQPKGTPWGSFADARVVDGT